mgnify:CR=1 FL=1
MSQNMSQNTDLQSELEIPAEYPFEKTKTTRMVLFIMLIIYILFMLIFLPLLLGANLSSRIRWFLILSFITILLGVVYFLTYWYIVPKFFSEPVEDRRESVGTHLRGTASILENAIKGSQTTRELLQRDLSLFIYQKFKVGRLKNILTYNDEQLIRKYIPKEIAYFIYNNAALHLRKKDYQHLLVHTLKYIDDL